MAGCNSTARRRSRAGSAPATARGEITLRQLLQMRSGLQHEEKAEPVYTSAEVRMMFLDGRDDMAGWAEAQPLEHEPGRVFEYSTPTAMILSDVIARVLAPRGLPADTAAAVSEFLARGFGAVGLASLTASTTARGR
jgi:CubicO group peptidase (beta-lactamase class C family)